MPEVCLRTQHGKGRPKERHDRDCYLSQMQLVCSAQHPDRQSGQTHPVGTTAGGSLTCDLHAIKESDSTVFVTSSSFFTKDRTSALVTFDLLSASETM